MLITGTHITYYFLCKRKLWFHARKINCEQESDIVLQGKVLHQNSFKGEKKEYSFEGIKIDWLDLKNKIIHEVKKSKSMEESHIWQLKYYLYYFKINNIEGFYGELNYPTIKQKQQVELSANDELSIKNYLKEIESIVESDLIPPIETKKSICNKCSYFELCYS